jgi:hypothetical protein
MGYESRLYIVEENNFLIPSDNGKVWAQVIGMINLCNCYPITDVFTEVANGYIYDTDGNTRIEEDRYGKPLSMASLEDVIEKLKEIVKELDYNRAKVALGFLKSVQKSMPDCVVYHYGY